MNYLSVAETAKKWNISERSVRNYCAQERIPVSYTHLDVYKRQQYIDQHHHAPRMGDFIFPGKETRSWV